MVAEAYSEMAVLPAVGQITCPIIKVKVNDEKREKTGQTRIWVHMSHVTYYITVRAYA